MTTHSLGKPSTFIKISPEKPNTYIRCSLQNNGFGQNGYYNQFLYYPKCQKSRLKYYVLVAQFLDRSPAKLRNYTTSEE